MSKEKIVLVPANVLAQAWRDRGPAGAGSVARASRAPTWSTVTGESIFCELALPSRHAMPLREYDCPKCGTFEVIQKMDAAPLEKHEACGAEVTRRMSRSSFQLKGGGWYSDGYATAGSACGTAGGCAGGACPLPD